MKDKTVKTRLSGSGGPVGEEGDWTFVTNMQYGGPDCNVRGYTEDDKGQAQDITNDVTMTAVSLHPDKVSVVDLVGVSFVMHSLKATETDVTADVKFEVTWKDGSRGPVGYIIPCEVVQCGDGPEDLDLRPGAPSPQM